ncbi:hypothetical protein JW851_00975 [Candidatus Woesearchaeota archaeon]|nr:hypothetical protein [Candidatus Woesearchaeota archaeon]
MSKEAKKPVKITPRPANGGRILDDPSDEYLNELMRKNPDLMNIFFGEEQEGKPKSVLDKILDSKNRLNQADSQIAEMKKQLEQYIKTEKNLLSALSQIFEKRTIRTVEEGIKLINISISQCREKEEFYEKSQAKIYEKERQQTEKLDSIISSFFDNFNETNFPDSAERNHRRNNYQRDFAKFKDSCKEDNEFYLKVKLACEVYEYLKQIFSDSRAELDEERDIVRELGESLKSKGVDPQTATRKALRKRMAGELAEATVKDQEEIFERMNNIIKELQNIVPGLTQCSGMVSRMNCIGDFLKEMSEDANTYDKELSELRTQRDEAAGKHNKFNLELLYLIARIENSFEPSQHSPNQEKQIGFMTPSETLKSIPEELERINSAAISCRKEIDSLYEQIADLKKEQKELYKENAELIEAKEREVRRVLKVLIEVEKQNDALKNKLETQKSLSKGIFVDKPTKYMIERFHKVKKVFENYAASIDFCYTALCKTKIYTLSSLLPKYLTLLSDLENAVKAGFDGIEADARTKTKEKLAEIIKKLPKKLKNKDVLIVRKNIINLLEEHDDDLRQIEQSISEKTGYLVNENRSVAEDVLRAKNLENLLKEEGINVDDVIFASLASYIQEYYPVVSRIEAVTDKQKKLALKYNFENINEFSEAVNTIYGKIGSGKKILSKVKKLSKSVTSEKKAVNLIKRLKKQLDELNEKVSEEEATKQELLNKYPISKFRTYEELRDWVINANVQLSDIYKEQKQSEKKQNYFKNLASKIDSEQGKTYKSSLIFLMNIVNSDEFFDLHKHLSWLNGLVPVFNDTFYYSNDVVKAIARERKNINAILKADEKRASLSQRYLPPNSNK